jgi:hypothetical protein
MAAPDYVPVSLADLPRQEDAPKPPDSWRADRPADLRGPQPAGPKLGSQGPDQGFALALARRLENQIYVFEGENREDAIAGAVAVAMKRASLFGRAPVIYDLEHALRLFGFIGTAPPDLVAFRRKLFETARQHYWDQRAIVDIVPTETLRLTPAQVKEQLSNWRALLAISPGSPPPPEPGA